MLTSMQWDLHIGNLGLIVLPSLSSCVNCLCWAINSKSMRAQYVDIRFWGTNMDIVLYSINIKIYSTPEGQLFKTSLHI